MTSSTPSNVITRETFADPGYPFPAYSPVFPLTSIPAEYITETELAAALAANN
jgi:hypothetical protein